MPRTRATGSVERLTSFSKTAEGCPFYLEDEMKMCAKCHKEKPAKDFCKYRSGKNKGYLHSYCRDCENDYALTGGKAKVVLDRDEYKCQHCGMTNDEQVAKRGLRLVIHHIDGKGKSLPRKEKNNDLNNLMTLCSVCHGKIHGGQSNGGLRVHKTEVYK